MRKNLQFRKKKQTNNTKSTETTVTTKPTSVLSDTTTIPDNPTQKDRLNQRLSTYSITSNCQSEQTPQVIQQPGKIKQSTSTMTISESSKEL